MNPYPGTPAKGARARDFDVDFASPKQSVGFRCRSMTEHGSWPAGENCGVPPSLAAHQSVPDGVDAEMERLQAPSRHQAIDFA
jgi:hypothetical protein